jgi:hypothetical protein
MTMTTTNTITITWKAFSNPELLNRPNTSATFDLVYDTAEVDDEKVCDILFHQTNVYSGNVWRIIEPLLPTDRTHTALSVGDEVTINENTYRCENVGWQLLKKVGA